MALFECNDQGNDQLGKEIEDPNRSYAINDEPIRI